MRPFTRFYLLFLLSLLFILGSILSGQTKMPTDRYYFLEDFQYYKPMIADIRTSQHHAQFYVADSVSFANTASNESEERHFYADPSFGEYFPVIGMHFKDPDNIDEDDAMKLPGITMFFDANAHLLLDFNTESNDVINTDYRFGAGVALRVPKMTSLSLRLRYFHESTHIGDEYTLSASLRPDFRRYNVSYEAFESFASLDYYMGQSLPVLMPSYLRLYGGWRKLNKDKYDGYTGTYETAPGLILESDQEFQIGGELFFSGWPSPDNNPGWNWVQKLLAPQQFFAAADLYQRSKYAITEPEQVMCTNIIVGVLYGKYFNLTGKRAVRWQLNFYDGINPHGQFRMEDLTYFGLDYVIDF